MRKTDQSYREFERAADRVFCEDSRWYVRTREGLRGPFGSRRAAEAEAALFVDTMTYLERAGATLPADVNGGDVTVVNIDQMPWH